MKLQFLSVSIGETCLTGVLFDGGLSDLTGFWILEMLVSLACIVIRVFACVHLVLFGRVNQSCLLADVI